MNELIIAILNSKSSKQFGLFLFLISFICPGALFLFFVYPELTLKLDFFKLLLISISISSIFLFGGIMIAVVFLSSFKLHSDDLSGPDTYVIIGSVATLSILCLISFLEIITGLVSKINISNNVIYTYAFIFWGIYILSFFSSIVIKFSCYLIRNLRFEKRG